MNTNICQTAEQVICFCLKLVDFQNLQKSIKNLNKFVRVEILVDSSTNIFLSILRSQE